MTASLKELKGKSSDERALERGGGGGCGGQRAGHAGVDSCTGTWVGYLRGRDQDWYKGKTTD